MAEITHIRATYNGEEIVSGQVIEIKIGGRITIYANAVCDDNT